MAVRHIDAYAKRAQIEQFTSIIQLLNACGNECFPRKMLHPLHLFFEA